MKNTKPALLLLSAVVACGSNADAAIGGKVTDPSGAPVPGAVVRLEKGEARAVTGARGEFAFPSNGPIDDIIVITKEGFLDDEQPVTSANTSGLVAKLIVCAATVTDIDGNVYQAVKLGDQIWTTANFRAKHFNDGTPIPFDAATPAWKDNTTPLYCLPKNVTEPLLLKKFGLLYNFHTVETKKLAPAGWHVPSSAEWAAFEKQMIASGFNWDGSTAGDKIAKAISAKTSWDPSSVEGAIGNDPGKNNRSGFSAYGTGFRHESGIFEPVGHYTGWWTSTPASKDHAGMIDLHSNQPNWSNAHHYRSACGYTVRLVKDGTP